MMGDWDYVVPNVRVLETKNDRIKNAILKKEIEEAIKNKRRADAIYGSDEEYYQKYHPGREIPRDETEELKSRYIEVNNVLYPRDIAEIDELVKSAQAELEAIERERWMGHTKNAIGAAISIGSAFIPATTGARITEILAKALAPKLGTKLAFEVARNSVIGAMSGATMGLGDSLIYNENPLETMLRYAIINSAIGAGSGALGYEIARNNAQNAILKNPANKELLEKYYQEYVEGFENKANELSEYRRIKNGIEERGKTSTDYDKIDKYNSIDEFDYAKVKKLINDLKHQKTTYTKGENMSAGTLNELLKSGSDIPPIDFVPRNVKIGHKDYKEIWLNNQKQVSSSFVKWLSNQNSKKIFLTLPLSDGYKYYAKIVDGVPVFYKKVRFK